MDPPDLHHAPDPAAMQKDVQVVLRTVRRIEEEVQSVRSSQQRIESWLAKQGDHLNGKCDGIGHTNSVPSSILHHQMTSMSLNTVPGISTPAAPVRRVSQMLNNMPLPSASLSKELQEAVANVDAKGPTTLYPVDPNMMRRESRDQSSMFSMIARRESKDQSALLPVVPRRESRDHSSWFPMTGRRESKDQSNFFPLTARRESKDHSGMSPSLEKKNTLMESNDHSGMLPIEEKNILPSMESDDHSDMLPMTKVTSGKEPIGHSHEPPPMPSMPSKQTGSTDLRGRPWNFHSQESSTAKGLAKSLTVEDTTVKKILSMTSDASYNVGAVPSGSSPAWFKQCSSVGDDVCSVISGIEGTESVATRISLKSRQSDLFSQRPAVKRQVTAAYADAQGPKYIKQKAIRDRSASKQRNSGETLGSGREKKQRRSTNWSVPGRVPSSPHHHQSTLHRIVSDPYFEAFSAVFTMLHALVIAAYVEYMASHDSKVHPALKVSNQILSVLFSIEVILKLIVEKKEFYAGEEGFWNAFDSVLAVMVVIEIFMYLPLSWGDEHRALVRAFLKMGEIVRTARLLRIFRMLRFSSALRMILAKLFGSLKTLFWVIVLICALLFVIAVCITQGAATYLIDLKDDELDMIDITLVERNYGSVAKTLITLFKSVTGGTPWGIVADVLMDINFIYAGIFFAYIGFTVFAVLNIVTGVFVDAAMQSSLQERDLVAEGQMKKDERSARHLREVFFDMSHEDEGVISNEQFCLFLEDEWVASYMKALKIDTSDANQLFRLLDLDNSGEILIDEFVEGCMKLRGEAKSMDLHILICEHRRLMVIFRDFVSYAERQFDEMRTVTTSLHVQSTQGHSHAELGRRPSSAPPARLLKHDRPASAGHKGNGLRRLSDASQRNWNYAPSMHTICSNDEDGSCISSPDENEVRSTGSEIKSVKSPMSLVESDVPNGPESVESAPAPPHEHPFGLTLEEVRESDYSSTELSGPPPYANDCR